MKSRFARLSCACALALALGCTADNTASLRAMGDWIQQDSATFSEEIRTAPAWAREGMRSDSQNLSTSVGLVVNNTVEDANRFQASMSTLPDDISRGVRENTANLSSDVNSMGLWVKQDSRTFSDTVNGTPGFISDSVSSDARALQGDYEMLVGQVRETADEFPKMFSYWIQFIFFF